MKLPERIQNRLKDFDYSQNGAYFITVCVKNRRDILWRYEDNADSDKPMPLSKYGIVTEIAIKNIPNHYNNISVEKYVIMPNHIHMILLITGENNIGGRIIFAPTVSKVVKQMKAFVTKQIGSSIWQKSFHDHIIRNEQDYQEIWEYIDANPLKRKDDCYFG